MAAAEVARPLSRATMDEALLQQNLMQPTACHSNGNRSHRKDRWDEQVFVPSQKRAGRTQTKVLVDHNPPGPLTPAPVMTSPNADDMKYEAWKDAYAYKEVESRAGRARRQTAERPEDDIEEFDDDDDDDNEGEDRDEIEEDEDEEQEDEIEDEDEEEEEDQQEEEIEEIEEELDEQEESLDDRIEQDMEDAEAEAEAEEEELAEEDEEYDNDGEEEEEEEEAMQIASRPVAARPRNLLLSGTRGEIGTEHIELYATIRLPDWGSMKHVATPSELQLSHNIHLDASMNLCASFGNGKLKIVSHSGGGSSTPMGRRRVFDLRVLNMRNDFNEDLIWFFPDIPNLNRPGTPAEIFLNGKSSKNLDEPKDDIASTGGRELGSFPVVNLDELKVCIAFPGIRDELRRTEAAPARFDILRKFFEHSASLLDATRLTSIHFSLKIDAARLV